MSRSHHSGTSPVHRYLNGRMLDGQRGSDMEPDATAGLLQHAGSGPEDDDDGLVLTTVADGPAAEHHAVNTAAPAVSSGNATVAGSQLNASGTEISLDGVRTVGQSVGSNAMMASGKGGGGGAPSSVSLKSAWKLKYQDFLPDKKGAGANNFNPISSEQFQKLVDRANDWLDKNRDVQVKTCQTLTWMSHDMKRLGSGEQMVLSKNFCENSTTYFIRGLRLWLVPRQQRRQQSINFTDFTPDGPTDTIKNLIAKVNRKIDSKQLKGHILTVETFNGPILNGKFDSRITRWTESINDDSPHAFAVRVFHCRHGGGGGDGNSGPGSHNSKHSNVIESSHIDIRDVVPQATEDGYEGFEDLVERTNTWLKDQSDILVINMQSIMVQKDDNDPHSETGNACYYVVPGLNSASPVDFFRILRIAYRQPKLPDTSAKAATDLDLPVIYPFTYETFTPELVRVGFNTAGGVITSSGGKLAPPAGPGSAKERLETMNETFSKVMAFLQNSGADVICAEMVSNPMQLYASDSTALSGPDEIQFLLTIRLFLTGQICRVDGSLASIKRASIVSTRGVGGTKNSARGGGGGGDRDDRPGPIFLRSVVTRQFKYRWLVLAISAFFSMTVIVALSVVYSNR